MKKNLYVISNEHYLNEFVTVVSSDFSPDEMLEVMYILEKYYSTLQEMNIMEDKEPLGKLLQRVLIKAFPFESKTTVVYKELDDWEQEVDVEEISRLLNFPDEFSIISSDDNENDWGEELYERHFKGNYHINFDKIVRNKDKSNFDMTSIEVKWSSNILKIENFIKDKKEEELVYYKKSKEEVLEKLKDKTLSIEKREELNEELLEWEESIEWMKEEIEKL